MITLVIDGGLGRVITAIPALETFVEKCPDTRIITYGWGSIIWGNKKLVKLVMDNNLKGLFDIIKDTRIMKPEPYFCSDYMNAKINLIDAWNQAINHDAVSMPIPKIYLSQKEINGPRFRNRNPIVAFQPFGSTANIDHERVMDSSNRSLTADFTIKLIKRFKRENIDILFLCDKPVPFVDGNDFIKYFPENCRWMAAAIANVDYFVGIDSSGQHMARCFNKPGSIIMGGTDPVNTSYPDFFNILNTENISYNPYRICEMDGYLAEIENSNNMMFDKHKTEDMIDKIILDLRAKIGNVYT